MTRELVELSAKAMGYFRTANGLYIHSNSWGDFEWNPGLSQADSANLRDFLEITVIFEPSEVLALKVFSNGAFIKHRIDHDGTPAERSRAVRFNAAISGAKHPID